MYICSNKNKYKIIRNLNVNIIYIIIIHNMIIIYVCIIIEIFGRGILFLVSSTCGGVWHCMVYNNIRESISFYLYIDDDDDYHIDMIIYKCIIILYYYLLLCDS